MKNPTSWRDRLSARLDTAPGSLAAPGSRFASFRRLYRWLNLTLVHQGVWPLLIVLLGAPVVRPAAAPFPWELAATGAPAVAALAALLYLAQRRPGRRVSSDAAPEPDRPLLTDATGKPAANPADSPFRSPPRIEGSGEVTLGPGGRSGAGQRFRVGGNLRHGERAGQPPMLPTAGSLPAVLQGQARLLLFGVAIVLAIARLMIGPPLSTGAYLLFGIADVLAFQLIHFGVVAGSFGEQDQGQAVAVLLFGLSWSLRELFLAGVGVGNADLGLAFGGGLAVGLGVGLVSRMLRRWPGGFWPGGFWAGAAGHWLLIYLFFGFVG